MNDTVNGLHEHDDNNVHGTNGEEERNEQDELFDEYKYNSWTATGPMADLQTRIFKDNLLSASSRKSMLQNQPKNKDISFTPLDMDKKM